jgi:two-component system, LuxR family, sensor kinase FixL
MAAPSLSLQGLKVLFYRGHLRPIGVQVVAVAVLLLLSAVVLLGVNVTKMQESFAWVHETDEELIQIAEVDKRLVANELAVRGYALTDDPVFLTYYRNEAHLMNAALDKLGKSQVDDPSDIQREFVRTRELVGQRLDQFAHLVGLGPGHAPDVANAIRDPHYRTVMRAARASVEAMRNLELAELAGRQVAATRQAKNTYGLAVCIVVFAFVFGALGVVAMVFGRSSAS